MSGYTIGEIVVWLLLAAVLGFGLGWLLRELKYRSESGVAAPAAAAVTEPPVEIPVKPAEPPVKKAPVKKAPAKKTPAKKTPAKKTPAKKTPAKKTPAKRTPAKRTPAKRTPAT
jgi:hypothetical protein